MRSAFPGRKVSICSKSQLAPAVNRVLEKITFEYETSISNGKSVSPCRRDRSPFAACLFLLLIPFGSRAEGPVTVIDVGTTVLRPGVKRFGINLGTLTFYDSGQTLRNLLVRNPGFEGQIWNSTVRCASGSATSCVDENQWSGWPAGFWNGATFEVFFGAAEKRSGKVVESSATSKGQGSVLTFDGPGQAPGKGDYLILRKSVPGEASAGWWPSARGAGKVADNTTDLPPGTLGSQTVSLTAPSTSDFASIASYFDSTKGKTFVQLNGSYELRFKAKGTGGSNKIELRVARADIAPYLAQTEDLSTDWKDYSVRFDASENGTAMGMVGAVFSTVGADSFELDDVSLTKTNSDSSNTTVFRDEVVNALRDLQPSTLRDWSGQLGETLDNLLRPEYGRQRSGYSAWASDSDSVGYGLHDFLQLCGVLKADPWFAVPSTFSAADASNLIQYLAGDATTVYGAKRASLGHPAPWTETFSKIHLEFGNEAWNSVFKGGTIEYPDAYGKRAQSIFAAMRLEPSYVPARFDLVLGGQAAWPGRDTEIQNNCNNNDSFTTAVYSMGTVNTFLDDEALFGSTLAEPEAYMAASGTAEGLTPGMVYQDFHAIQSSSHPVPLSFYEINMGTMSGGITQDVLSSYASSLGAGLAIVDTMLQGVKQFNVLDQELFALSQYEVLRPDGKRAPLWGAVMDMGVTDRKRPQFLAMQLANRAIGNGASMVETVHSGADPVWSQPAVNAVQFNRAHLLQSFAFASDKGRSIIIFNLSRTAELPVTFGGVNAPNGTVLMWRLNAASVKDTNESANMVRVDLSGLPDFNSLTPFVLPAHSMTVLKWSAPEGNTAPGARVPPTISSK